MILESNLGVPNGERQLQVDAVKSISLNLHESGSFRADLAQIEADDVVLIAEVESATGQ